MSKILYVHSAEGDASASTKLCRTSDMGRRGPLPKKRRKIADWVRHEIVKGRYRGGDALPDRNWFMREFAANRHSVQNAFDELRREGFVEAIRGHGTRVTRVMPFAGRYLMLVKSAPDDAGSRLFANALKESVAVVSRRRGVKFDIADIADAPSDSQRYADLLSRIRSHFYAGVFAQSVTKGHGLETVTNIDNVPIAFQGARSDLAMGSAAVGLGGWASDEVYRRHFADCRDSGVRRIAVFAPIPVGDVALRREKLSELAAKYGLKIVRCGYQAFSMRVWNDYAFRRFLELFFSSDAGREAEAVVLADDNFLVPFAETCRAELDEKADSRYVVCSHANRPNLPKTDFPVRFHGFDWPTTIESFIDYAEDVRAFRSEPRRPEAVMF